MSLRYWLALVPPPFTVLLKWLTSSLKRKMKLFPRSHHFAVSSSKLQPDCLVSCLNFLKIPFTYKMMFCFSQWSASFDHPLPCFFKFSDASCWPVISVYFFSCQYLCNSYLIMHLIQEFSLCYVSKLSARLLKHFQKTFELFLVFDIKHSVWF